MVEPPALFGTQTEILLSSKLRRFGPGPELTWCSPVTIGCAGRVTYSPSLPDKQFRLSCLWNGSLETKTPMDTGVPVSVLPPPDCSAARSGRSLTFRQWWNTAFIAAPHKRIETVSVYLSSFMQDAHKTWEALQVIAYIWLPLRVDSGMSQKSHKTAKIQTCVSPFDS